MAIQHNYLNTSGFKPTAGEASQAELIVNLADGTLWTENTSSTVIQVGGGTYIGGTGITISGSNVNHDSHTGDVTGSTVLTIGANKVLTSHILNSNVTLAKLQNIGTDTFIGRTTAGTGVPETLSKAAALAILNVEDGAEVNNISDVNAGLLTGASDTTLHFHSADRNRANHTGTQLASTISDFQSTVSSNTDVSASKTITDHISVTQAVDLDDIESRVNALDASVVLMGEWDASAGDFPDAANTTPSLGVTIVSGMSWIVSTGGTVNSVAFTANDRIIALVDSASNTVYAGNWHKADYTDEVLSVNTQTGAVVLDADDISDAATTNKFVTASDITKLGNLSGTNSGDQNLFSTIAVATQSSIVADVVSDTLTVAAGAGISLTTNASTDTLTITSTASGTTNLTASYTGITFDVESSSGSDVTIAQAISGGNAGAMSGADKAALDTAVSNQTGSLLTGESA